MIIEYINKQLAQEKSTVQSVWGVSFDSLTDVWGMIKESECLSFYDWLELIEEDRDVPTTFHETVLYCLSDVEGHILPKNDDINKDTKPFWVDLLHEFFEDNVLVDLPLTNDQWYRLTVFCDELEKADHTRKDIFHDIWLTHHESFDLTLENSQKLYRFIIKDLCYNVFETLTTLTKGYIS